MHGKRNILNVIMTCCIVVTTLLPASMSYAQITDVSDSLFSIVVPSAMARDIDMGNVLLGASRDSVLSDFCVNTGVVDIRIDALYADGAQAADFAIVSGRAPFRVPRGGGHAVGFSFTPTAAGVRSAQLVMITQVDTQRYVIRGMGVEPSIAVEAGMIDFGVVPVGGRRDSTLDIMLRNLSAAALRVSDVEAGGPDLQQFSIVSGNAPFILPPLAVHAMTLRFAPRRGGRSSGSLLFTVDGLADRPVARLFGEGRQVQAAAVISVDEHAARAGDIVSIPLRLASQENLLLSGAQYLYTELHLDASLLVPFAATPKGEIRDGYRVIALDDIPMLLAEGGVLHSLDFVATLGSVTETPLLLMNSAARGGNVELTEISGHFRLLDICDEGGERLFSSEGMFRLLPNQPNPFNSQTILRFELIESVHTTLDLLDVAGRVVATPYSGFSRAGLHQLRFDASALPTGMYMLRLRAGALQTHRLLHVLK
jgi:hypothetical protein